MLRILALVAILCVSFSCKKDEGDAPAADKKVDNEQPKADEPKADEPEADEPEADEPEGDVLKIEPANLEIKKSKNNPDGPSSLELTADGEIKADDKVVGKLTADGKMMDQDGKHVATITADGEVTFEGESETLTIGEDGAIEKDDKGILGIGDDGAITGDGTKEMSEKIVFKGSDGAKRAMMFAFMSAMLRSGGAEPPEATEAKAKAVDKPEPKKKAKKSKKKKADDDGGW